MRKWNPKKPHNKMGTTIATRYTVYKEQLEIAAAVLAREKATINAKTISLKIIKLLELGAPCNWPKTLAKDSELEAVRVLCRKACPGAYEQAPRS